MILKNKIILILSGLLLFIISCEKEIELDVPPGEEDIVVYGFIEQDSIPFVALTRSVPAFETIKLEALQDGFVRNAVVTLNNGDTTIQLFEREFSINEYFKYYFYTVPFSLLSSYKGEIGKTYTLKIKAEGKELTAVTTIPQLAPLDSIWTMPHPKKEEDSLVSLWVKYIDPPEAGNFIRFTTKRNSELFFPGYFESVFDDGLINGKSFSFSLPRGQDRDTDIDHDNFSYFGKGDTVIVNWSAIDKAHHDFWNTFEIDRNGSGNPFGSPVQIISNVEGGLGIWGGYAASYYTIIIPK